MKRNPPSWPSFADVVGLYASRTLSEEGFLTLLRAAWDTPAHLSSKVAERGSTSYSATGSGDGKGLIS